MAPSRGPSFHPGQLPELAGGRFLEEAGGTKDNFRPGGYFRGYKGNKRESATSRIGIFCSWSYVYGLFRSLLFIAVFFGRSANLGDCVQPCRWRYFLKEEKRPESELEIEEDEQGSYILNSRDLCLLEYLAKLQQAGVDSFKIEGRNKSVYYLSVV